MPLSCRYVIAGEQHDLFHHTPAKKNDSVNMPAKSDSCEPIDILSDFHKSVPEIPVLNLKGVRWKHVDVIAKSLQEIEPQIIEGLNHHNYDPSDPNIVLITSVKDGADGMDDVSVHKEISDRFLPDKAFRFSFCIFKIELINKENERCLIFNEEKPNSLRTNRPLLEVICDVNNHSSTCVCLSPIANERNFMKNNIMCLGNETGGRPHKLQFYNSMIDEKLDRMDGGLAGNGFRYPCTLCEATRETAKSQLGSFENSRTYDETYEIAEYIRINPDQLSKNQLENVSKGVKSIPLLYADAKR